MAHGPKGSAWESHWEVSPGYCPKVLARPGGTPCPRLPVAVTGRCQALSDASLAIPSPLPGSDISDFRQWVLDSPAEAGTGTPAADLAAAALWKLHAVSSRLSWDQAAILTCLHSDCIFCPAPHITATDGFKLSKLALEGTPALASRGATAQ